jgi:hypothetical protein
MPTYLDVDPRTLHLPPGMWQGANPGKLARQLSKFGTSTAGMPPLFVHTDPDGRLMLMDGVTRAARVAKCLPGVLVRVEVIGTEPQPVASYPTVADRLP